MTTTLSPSATPHAPWNKGKLVRQKPHLKLWEIWTVRTCLRMAGKTRDLRALQPGHRQQTAEL